MKTAIVGISMFCVVVALAQTVQPPGAQRPGKQSPGVKPGTMPTRRTPPAKTDPNAPPKSDQTATARKRFPWQPGQPSPGAKNSLTVKKYDVIDYSYARIHNPAGTLLLVDAVQKGRMPRSHIEGLASKRTLDALLATSWKSMVPETRALPARRPPAVGGDARFPSKSIQPSNPPSRKSSSVSSQQKNASMPSARKDVSWTSILQASTKGPASVSGSSGKDFMKAYLSSLVDYSPAKIDFGNIPYWDTRTLAITLTSPSKSKISAAFKKVPVVNPDAPPGPTDGEIFKVVRMYTYTGELSSQDGTPTKDKQVLGGGPIAVEAGQDLVIEVNFKNLPSGPKMGGTNPTLQVGGDAWAVEIPGSVGLLDIEKQALAAKPDDPIVNLCNGTESWAVNGGLVGVSLTNIGVDSLNATFEAVSLPTGITLAEAPSVALPNGDKSPGHVTLKFAVEPGTQDMRTQPGVINVVFGDNKRVAMSLSFTVRKSGITWGGPQTKEEVRDKVLWWWKVYAWSNGDWFFETHWWDSSIFTGDAFCCQFFFKARIDNQEYGSTIMGTLGTETSDRYFGMGGSEVKIRDHWAEIYDQGVGVNRTAYTDYSNVLGDLWDWVKENWPAIVALAVAA